MNTPLKIAFLDRDGVINKNAAPHEYITTVADFEVNKGLTLLTTRLRELGYTPIVITNQRGVAREKLSLATLEAIHARMREWFAREGWPLLDIFYCPHAEGECDCRKPRPGMLKAATQKYSIDLTTSLFISDSRSDIEMGKDFGIEESILVQQDHPEEALAFL